MVYKAQDGISSEDLKRIANEQIIDDKCERSGDAIEKRKMPQ